MHSNALSGLVSNAAHVIMTKQQNGGEWLKVTMIFQIKSLRDDVIITLALVIIPSGLVEEHCFKHLTYTMMANK